MSSTQSVNGDNALGEQEKRPLHNSGSNNSGAEGQSLLCSESMLSTSPPADHRPDVWKKLDSHNNNNNLAADKLQNNVEAKRMNRDNGNRMTGPGTTSSSESWISQVSRSQAGQHAASILSSDTQSAAAILPPTAAQGGQSSYFRPPVGEHPHAALYSGPYSPTVYSTSSLQPFSSTIYTTQPSAISSLSPYYYPQYPPSFAARHLMPQHYSQIDSYSAMLQGMSSHVVQQSQVGPRSPFLSGGPHIPPFLPATTAGHTPSSHIDPLRSSIRSHSLSRDPKEHERTMAQHRSVSPPKEMGRSIMQEHRRSPESIRRLTQSREGSLKQRILRPPDINILSSTLEGHHQHHLHERVGEPSPKRIRSLGQPPPLQSTSSAPSATMGPPTLPPPPPLQPASYPIQPHFPPHFRKGSIIQLANGQLKRVEDLKTEDFINSAEVSGDLKIDSSTVVKIEEFADKGTAILGFIVGENRVQVTVEATVEHPFYVFGRGWSSCRPDRTLNRYGLECSKLQVGDVCISLTHREPTSTAQSQISGQMPQMLSMETQTKVTTGSERKRRWSAPDQFSVEEKEQQERSKHKT